MSRSLLLTVLSPAGWESIDYAARACLYRVRRQRVQIRMRRRTPSTMMVTGWTFGLNLRFVLRFEWLTLCPNPGFFPQSSQVATGQPSTQVVESRASVRSGTISATRTCCHSWFACRLRHRGKPSIRIAAVQTAPHRRTRRAPCHSTDRAANWYPALGTDDESGRIDRKGHQ